MSNEILAEDYENWRKQFKDKVYTNEELQEMWQEEMKLTLKEEKYKTMIQFDFSYLKELSLHGKVGVIILWILGVVSFKRKVNNVN